MATTKKSTKKAPAKKTAVKRAPAKSSASKVTHVTKSAKTHAPKKDSFMTFRITHEACYWVIFGAAVILLALWVLSVNVRVNALYDQIDQSNSDVNNITIPQKHVRN